MVHEELFFNTDPVDQAAVSAAVFNLYNFCYSKSITSSHWKEFTSIAPVSNPKIVFVDGPTELAEKIGDEECVDLSRFNDVVHFVDKRSYGSSERVSSVIRQIFKNIPYSKKEDHNWDGPFFKSVSYLLRTDHASNWEKLAVEVWKQTYACFTFQDACYVVNRPQLVEFNERGLHCKDGSAIVFRDGTEAYC